METRTALVTGANKGIGLATVRQLAAAGYTVWLGSRDPERGAGAAADIAGDVRAIQLDVTDQRSVDAAADRIREEGGTLDVLVNNAGVAIQEGEGLPSTVDPEAIKGDLDVNFFGSLRVTQTFLPLVKRSHSGRIVNVSSTMGSLSTLLMEETPLGKFAAYAYPASKTMVNTLTGWLSFELADTPVKVNSVCPGFVDTDINGHQGTLPPAEAAKVVVHAATLPADGPTGTFFRMNGTVGW